MFSKILIANRGEIAVRIIRACKEMGILTVAVYSQADADALHVALADESCCIGRAEATDSYLNAGRIISAALATGAKAIHPGYGFLSEDPEFAALCAANGLVFIGPTPENMKKAADKQKIKDFMAAAGLTVIPGSRIAATSREAREAADGLGYPVMLKARAGGGGRGIRLVREPEQLEAAFVSASAEAKAAFRDGALYVEKYISPAKHIEMQVLADEQGHAVCLGERDCSVQRHNQKLIEESPAPTVTQTQRAELMELCSRAVKKLGYVGAGTLEFLYDGRSFYFMEMNVRLQVEHTVTEMLTHIDLVKWQIRIAAGVPLSFTQADVDLRGSAIECRINALSPGRVSSLHVPGGPFVRFDTYLVTGMEITPYYDALLGKLAVCAGEREESLRKLRAALCELVIGGVETNQAEQLSTAGSAAFERGDYELGAYGR
jgi:acetyl-CoA carboxylase biotin carboxylase subunit